MMAAIAPPMLTAPRAAAAALDGRVEEDEEAVAAPALVALVRVVDASVASEAGDEIEAVKLEKPVGTAEAASELMVPLLMAVALLDGEAEPEADGVKSGLEMPNCTDHW